MKTLVCFTAACAAVAAPVWADSIVPTDMAPTCVVAPDTFKGWFADDTIAANAAVNAPDSVTFTTTYGDPDKCDFYTWGAQMFLWLTSTDSTKLCWTAQISSRLHRSTAMATAFLSKTLYPPQQRCKFAAKRQTPLLVTTLAKSVRRVPRAY